jgi:hypothetical protein
MRVFGSLLRAFALLTAFSYLFPRQAHAYMDPGTGSYILQLVIAALLGVSFAIKMFWLRIKTFLANLISKKPKDD